VKFTKICEFGVAQSLLGELTMNQSLSGERCIVYSLVCIFIVSSSSSISFVVLLNCFYLSP